MAPTSSEKGKKDDQITDELIHSHELLIEKIARQKVREELEQTSSYVKGILKVLGIMGSVILAILTILGITTYFDVKKTVEEQATKQVAAQLSSGNDKNQIDFVMRKSLIYYYTILLAKERSISNKDYSTVAIEKADFDQMRKLLTSEKLDNEEFLSTMNILIHTNNVQMRNQLFQTATSLLSDDKAWMKEHQSLKAEMLDQLRERVEFDRTGPMADGIYIRDDTPIKDGDIKEQKERNSDLFNVCLRFVKENENTEDLRRSAFRMLGVLAVINTPELTTSLETIAADNNDYLSDAALNLLARLNPADAVVSTRINTIINSVGREKNSVVSIGKALSLIANIGEGIQYDKPEEKTLREKYISALWRPCLKRGFRLSKNSDDAFYLSLYGEGFAFQYFEDVNFDQIFGTASIDFLQGYVDSLAKQNNKEEIRKLVFSLCSLSDYGTTSYPATPVRIYINGPNLPLPQADSSGIIGRYASIELFMRRSYSVKKKYTYDLLYTIDEKKYIDFPPTMNFSQIIFSVSYVTPQRIFGE